MSRIASGVISPSPILAPTIPDTTVLEFVEVVDLAMAHYARV